MKIPFFNNFLFSYRIIKTALVLVLLHFISGIYSQTYDWKLTFNGILDNREYNKAVQYPQTILGARVDAEIGITFDSTQSFRAGFNYMHEYGNFFKNDLKHLVMYYHGQNRFLSLYLGLFPRKGLLDYPYAILTDTLLYYRPNIEGAILTAHVKWGYENVWCDWTSRQTDTIRETFLFGFSGRVQKSIFYLNHHLVMFHRAGAMINIPNDHIRDNGGFDVNVGLDLSEKWFLTKLYLQGGYLVSLDRNRKDMIWKMPKGFWIETMADYKGYGIKWLIYKGQGHDFLWGDAFYRAKSYSRLDMFATPVNNKVANLKVTISLHFISHRVNSSQILILIINFGNSHKLNWKPIN